MNILFIGYGKTSQRVAKQLFADGHQIYTMSRSAKTDTFAQHAIQDVHHLDLTAYPPLDWVYVLLSPDESNAEAYHETYVKTVQPIAQALKHHPVQRIVVVSSTRVYGEDEGQAIDDESPANPSDSLGRLLQQTEQLWQQAYPEQVIVIRPSGIYGSHVARMQKMAQATTYPHRHWTNRIHLDDLAGFLAYLTQIPEQQLQHSYIVSDSRPVLMHEILQWFQQQAGQPTLSVTDVNKQTGKRIYATRLCCSGFQLQYRNCFDVYQSLMAASS
ncbi:SDR family oxidoreductase [Acinetobacter sp.]|uniref:SDR family oxidoreductase n=1 Tax=Acinetobacter sp. TaxID=472 RepID=UPI0031E0150F